MLTVRVLLFSCIALILTTLRVSDGRIVYSRIPQYDPYAGTNENYSRRGGGVVALANSGGGGGGGTARYSHGHGHATSYQNFVLHSYHPVKVYLKPHHHHHDYN